MQVARLGVSEKANAVSLMKWNWNYRRRFLIGVCHAIGDLIRVGGIAQAIYNESDAPRQTAKKTGALKAPVVVATPIAG